MPTPLETRLQQLRAKGCGGDLCDRIETLIHEAAPAHLARLAPPRLAAQWGTDPGQTFSGSTPG